MENESNPIENLSDGDFSDHLSTLTPEQAKGTVDTFMDRTTADVDHPWNKSGTSAQKRYLDRVMQLRERSHADDNEGIQYDAAGNELQGRVSLEMQKIEKEAFEWQQQKTEKRVSEARSIMAELTEHGFTDDSDKIDSNIKSHEVRCLKLQLLHAKKSEDFMPALLSELQALGDHESIAVIHGFQFTDLFDESTMWDILGSTVEKINNKHKERKSQ